MEQDRNELDHLMASSGYEMTRYADDLVIQCKTLSEAESALAVVAQWTSSRGLTLHPTKTKIADLDSCSVRSPGFSRRLFAPGN